jgi:hypothetical protein
MTRVSRAVEKGETQGFMKAHVGGDSNEFLGAAILGTCGDEVIHCILDLIYARAPYTVMQWAMHINPTLSELIPTMLDQLRPLEARPSSMYTAVDVVETWQVRCAAKFRFVAVWGLGESSRA